MSSRERRPRASETLGESCPNRERRVTSDMKIRIGTRSSRLARWQADHVSSLLRSLGADPEIIYIETTGDRDKVRDFGSLGAKGIFVKEIEAALIERRIDVAVHSLKDLPTSLPDRLVLAAALEREDARDALISRDHLTLDALPPGSTVATGSLRRGAQIKALRPDLTIGPLRGNVPTRIGKIRDGEADATLLAVAGVRRLGLEAEIAQRFSVDQVTPSMGQGAIALETRSGEFEDLMQALDHAATRIAIEAERRFVATIGGGCRTPVGVHARLGDGPDGQSEGEGDGVWTLTAMISSPDGRSLIREARTAPDAERLGALAVELADEMFAKADDSIRAVLERVASEAGDEATSAGAPPLGP